MNKEPSEMFENENLDEILSTTPKKHVYSKSIRVIPEVIGPFTELHDRNFHPKGTNTDILDDGDDIVSGIDTSDLMAVSSSNFRELSKSAQYNISWYMKVLECSKTRVILKRFPWRNYWVMFLFISFGVLGYLFIPSIPRDPTDTSPVITLHADWPTFNDEWTIWRYIVYYYYKGKPFSIHKFAYLVIWVIAGITQAYPVEIAIFDRESEKLYTISQYPFPFSHIVFGLRYINNWINGCILKNPNPPSICNIPINLSADFRTFELAKITDVFTQSYDKLGSAWRVSLLCNQFPIYLTDLTVNDYSLSGEFAHDLASFLRSWLNIKTNLELDDYLSRIHEQRIEEAENGEARQHTQPHNKQKKSQ